MVDEDKDKKNETLDNDDKLPEGFVDYSETGNYEDEEGQEGQEAAAGSADKGPDDTGGEDTPPPEGGDASKETKTDEGVTPPEPPPFSLKEEIAEGTDEGKETDTPKTKIVHQGRVYEVTQDQLVTLAQQGFDYTGKVGRHAKIAQMIEADPEIANMVNDYWQKKVSGARPEGTRTQTTELPSLNIRPVNDYDSEVDWMRDNLEPIMATLKQLQEKANAPAPVQASPGSGKEVYEQMLAMRDPQYAHVIIPKLGEYQEQLTMSDYKKIVSDSTGARLCQFYDYVKQCELTKAGKPATTTTDPPLATTSGNDTPSFRVRSGGGEPPRTEDQANHAWDMSRSAFQKQLERVKFG